MSLQQYHALHRAGRKDRPTNGNTVTDADGRTIGVHSLCFICLASSPVFLPTTELLLCVFHLGTEVFFVGKVIALGRGRRVDVCHTRSQCASHLSSNRA